MSAGSSSCGTRTALGVAAGMGGTVSVTLLQCSCAGRRTRRGIGGLTPHLSASAWVATREEATGGASPSRSATSIRCNPSVGGIACTSPACWGLRVPDNELTHGTHAAHEPAARGRAP